MILREKVSPSELNTFRDCQLKWFLSYVLGYRDPSGKAAVIGNMSHYIMELIAKAKILQQDGKKWKKDMVVGRVTADLKIMEWMEKCWHFYKKQEKHLDFTEEDLKLFKKNVEKILADPFSPDNHSNIIAPEKRFNVPIGRDWSKFSIQNERGEVEEHDLRIKGFVDLLFRDDNKDLNYVDYKFGKSKKDWITGELIDFTYLHTNIQMCLYYWAMRKEEPNEDRIVAHIWYPNLNKRFTLAIDDDHVEEVMARVKSIVLTMRGLKKPSKCSEKWRCKFCAFSKKDFDKDSLNIPYNPLRDRFSPVNGHATICDAASHFLDHRSIDQVSLYCKNESKTW